MTHIPIEVAEEKNLPPLSLQCNTYHDDNHILRTTIVTVHLNQTSQKTEGET